jgi:hypothetical protein
MFHVKIVKKILLIYRDFLGKIEISESINKYDDEIRISGDSSGYWFIKGGIGNFEKYEKHKKSKYDEYGFYVTREIDKALASTALECIKLFKNDIFNFLGPDTRLDDIYLTSFDPAKVKKNSNSGNWHRDNCGHRLKIFACLEGDGTSPTLIIPKTNQVPYKFTFIEFLRQLKLLPWVKKTNAPVELRYQKGDLAMFDTHLLHRGGYEKSRSKRDILVIEFINKHKSNEISGLAPCGPGSNKNGMVKFSETAFQLLSSLSLLDYKLIKKLEDNSYSYTIDNMKCSH